MSSVVEVSGTREERPGDSELSRETALASQTFRQLDVQRESSWERVTQMSRELQKRYRIDARPLTCQLRVTKVMGIGRREQLGRYRLSMDLLKNRNQFPYLSFEVKPEGDCFLKEITLTPAKSVARIVTPPLEIGCARLTFALGYNWGTRAFNYSWRLKTKWSSDTKVIRKLPILEQNPFKLTSYWNVRQQLPQMGGENTTGEATVKSDIGRLQVRLNRIKLAATI